MTEEQVAQKILRFYGEQLLKRECEMMGKVYDADKFNEVFETMLNTEDGKNIVAKLSKAVENTA